MNYNNSARSIGSVGVHLRLRKNQENKVNITDLAHQAHQLSITYFQFFLTPQIKDTGYIKLAPQDRAQFLALKKEFWLEPYIHSSYWINPAIGNPETLAITQKSLKKEISLAKQLDVSTIVLHPGSASGHTPTPQDPYGKQQGIETLARVLGPIAKNNPDIQILLENTTHANRTIGSDLQDFVLLRDAFSDTPNIKFCLDIAHAFAYGYDVRDIDNFMTLLDNTMRISQIKLIHLNDTNEPCGSKKDVHVLPGNGAIGIQTLRDYCSHPLFQNIPKILELPETGPNEIKKVLTLFS